MTEAPSTPPSALSAEDEPQALTRESPLWAAARSYVRAARSERTRAAYRAQWATFTRFCALHQRSALPAQPETVALFLTARALEGRRAATLAQALAAIGQAHQLAGYASPRPSPEVRETFQGIRRTHGSAPAQKRPVLPDQLRAMLRTLPSSRRGLRDRALLLVGFAGAFRRSELVALTTDDLSFSADGLTVQLRRSKSDPEGLGRKVGIPRGRSRESCPVRSLEAWLSDAGITQGAIFRSVDRHGNLGVALHGRDVARVVQRSAAAAGLEPSQYAAHSLRAGLATAAAQAGKSAHVIMKSTGHRSVEMVQRYIRDAELFRDNAAAGLL